MDRLHHTHKSPARRGKGARGTTEPAAATLEPRVLPKPRPSRSRLLFEHKLAELQSLPAGWDGYDAEPPSVVSIDRGRSLLSALDACGRLPERILPLADGGVGIVLSVNPNYEAIECFNDGELVATFSDRKARNLAWRMGVGDLAGTLSRLRKLTGD